MCGSRKVRHWRSSQRFLLLSFTYLSQGCTPGEYSDIFIYVGSDNVFVFKILDFDTIWGFQKKMNIILSRKILWIFLGSFQNWTIFGGQFYVVYGLFLRSWKRNGTFFLCC